jgi:SAM-dependent methyltransferase
MSRVVDPRSPERLRAHYEIERELADRLRAGTFEERSTLYTAVYEELFERVPDHPQLTWVADEATRRGMVDKQLSLLAPFLGPRISFLEIGAGDCALSAAIAARTSGEVHAIDVSETIMSAADLPANVHRHVTDGREMPVAAGSIDVAYSNQLLEHLHPDDALVQTRNILKTLRPGGAYVCITPNRLSGPHDISMYFDEDPTGFHLREYTTGDLRELFREAGFTRTRAILPLPGRVVVVPALPLILLERLLDALPRGLGRRIARRTPLGRLLGRVVAFR